MFSKKWGMRLPLRRKFRRNPKKSGNGRLMGKGKRPLGATEKQDMTWDRWNPFALEERRLNQYKRALRGFKPRKNERGKWVLLEAFPKARKATRATANHKRKVYAVYVTKNGKSFSPFREFRSETRQEQVRDKLTGQLKIKRITRRDSRYRERVPIPRHPKEIDLSEANTRAKKIAAKDFILKFLPINLRNVESTAKEKLLIPKTRKKKEKLKKGQVDVSGAQAFKNQFSKDFHAKKSGGHYEFWSDFSKAVGESLYEIIGTMTDWNIRSKAYLSFQIKARFVMTTGDVVDIEPTFKMQAFQLQQGINFFTPWVREEVYAVFVYELVRLGLVTGGSATFVSKQKANQGKSPEDWVNWKGEHWGKHNFEMSEIKAFSYQVLRLQKVANEN